MKNFGWHMTIKHIKKRIYEITFYYLKELRDRKYKKKQQNRLMNEDFSILSTNCMGGILYHRYNMKFLSPTINLWFEPKDFVPFCENIRAYLADGRLLFIQSEKEYPVALLDCSGLPQVKIYFMHYLNEKEAAEKWNERSKRFNYDNYYIIGSDVGLDKEDIKRLAKIETNNTVIFTAGKWGHMPKCYTLEKYKGQNDVGKFINDIDEKTGVRYVESVFDFVSFFNTKQLLKIKE